MPPTGSLRPLLAGGDRRSVARSARAKALILKDPRKVAELAVLALDFDWLVSMRAMDLLEKLAHARPELVQPHKDLFLGPLADSEQWEIRLQIVRALPLLEWTGEERKRAVAILKRDAGHPQKFLKAWALDSLSLFALEDRRLMPFVLRVLDEFERSDSKALAVRARHVRDRFALPVRAMISPARPVSGSGWRRRR